MKRFLVTFCLLLITLFGSYSVINNSSVVANIPFSSFIVREAAEPSKLIIPALDIGADIEILGLDEENRMASPEDTNKAGWYKYGAKPGTEGNAVIAGHRDSLTGPALFYKLRDLETGDQVVVVDKFGKTYTYKVLRKETYKSDQFPLEEVFGFSKTKRLNLVTCEGVFNKEEKSYSDRLVVYTELVE